MFWAIRRTNQTQHYENLHELTKGINEKHRYSHLKSAIWHISSAQKEYHQRATKALFTKTINWLK